MVREQKDQRIHLKSLMTVTLGLRFRRQPHCLDLLTCLQQWIRGTIDKNSSTKSGGGGQAWEQMAVSGGGWSSNRGSRSQRRSRRACTQKILSTSQDGSLTNPAVWAQHSQDALRRAGILEERGWWGKEAGGGGEEKRAGRTSFLLLQASVSSGTGSGRLLLMPPCESKSGQLAARDAY